MKGPGVWMRWEGKRVLCGVALVKRRRDLGRAVLIAVFGSAGAVVLSTARAERETGRVRGGEAARGEANEMAAA